MFNFSRPVFETNNLNDVDIIFVADLFASDYNGGAELTSQALIDASPYTVGCIHAKDVNIELLKKAYRKFWIFGNFSSLDPQLIPSIISNMKYSVLEYDYKFCKYRSPEKHKFATGTDCDCHEQLNGKLISAFYHGAKSLWWMSEDQKRVYCDHFPFLKEHKNSLVLSSVLSANTLNEIKSLREEHKDTEKNGWVVLGSNSWIKGTDNAVEWCEKKNKDYKIIKGKTHKQFLKELASSKGFVYLPKGNDTCPRAVMEAKLLGCKLQLNDYVQHAKEAWFKKGTRSIEKYLNSSTEKFWSGIKDNINHRFTLSGYTTTKNCVEQKYPFKETIVSMGTFCDEVCVVDGGSNDGTWEELEELQNSDLFRNNDGTSRLKISRVERNWNDKRFAVFDGLQKALARDMCTGDFCWQMDSDEIVAPKDAKMIHNLIENFPANQDLLALPVIEYWGGPEKVRCDVNPWKWRLSRNKDYITHGIPCQLRKLDKDGNLYSAMGSDGCDYIRKDNHKIIPFVTFYKQEAEALRVQSHTNPEALKQYEIWFNDAIENLPPVYHFSWWSLERKIKTYKGYWTKHWNSLYNISLKDTAKNNMFFDKPWSEVTDQEINELANRLRSEMGGWIFHRKIDFDQPTKWLKCNRKIPALMREWCDKNG